MASSGHQTGDLAAWEVGGQRGQQLEFDYSVNPNVDPAVIHNFATCEWIAKSHPLCLVGDSGTGKSHLLIALGTAAAMAGYRVRYTTAAAVVRALIGLNDTQRRYAAPAGMMAHGLVMRTSRYLTTCTDALHALRRPKGLVFRQASGDGLLAGAGRNA